MCDNNLLLRKQFAILHNDHKGEVCFIISCINQTCQIMTIINKVISAWDNAVLFSEFVSAVYI